jgi:hypothetical protein
MVFGQAKPRVPRPTFAGAHGLVRDDATGIVVGIGATTELETVCFGFRDPEFRSGARVKFLGSILYEGAPGEPPKPRGRGRPRGFDALFDPAFNAYLRESGRSVETLCLTLRAALTAIASQEFGIPPDAVMITLRPYGHRSEGDVTVSPLPSDPAAGDRQAEPSELPAGDFDQGSDLGAMLQEVMALDASIPGKSHMFWGGGHMHPSGFHFENWEGAAAFMAKYPDIITVDQTPMGVRLDSITMRDGERSERFLTAVDALAHRIKVVSQMSMSAFTARIANVFWRAALIRFAQETSGHVHIFSVGADDNAAIIKSAMPALTVRANSGFIATINGATLPNRTFTMPSGQ